MTRMGLGARRVARHRRSAERRAAVRGVRPRLAVAWLAALLATTLVLQHPAALAGLLSGLVLGGAWLGASVELRRLLRLAVPFALVLLVVQTLIDRNGLTVLARMGDAGPLGNVDVTLEALVGATGQALRVIAGITVSAIGLALVDVDRVLGSVRRRAPRVGLTATLALRLAPALAADGRRYADGLRSRADGGPLTLRDRRLVVDAIVARTLDRATDAAAVLELRGLGATPRAAGTVRERRAPWSRVERAVVCATTAIVAAACWVQVAGLDRASLQPALDAAPSWSAALAGLGIGLVALLPPGFAADRQGRGR